MIAQEGFWEPLQLVDTLESGGVGIRFLKSSSRKTYPSSLILSMQLALEWLNC